MSSPFACRIRVHGLTLLLPILLALPGSPARGQDSTATTQLSLAGGRLFTTEGREVRFAALTLTQQSVQYRPAGQQGTSDLPLGQVLRIDREKGSESLKWGAMLGLSGLLGSLLGVAQAESSRPSGSTSTISSGAKTGLVVGCTGVSVLIGLAIGAGHKIYTTAYENPAHRRP